MDVAIVGAGGACGRQLAIQLLDRGTLDAGARLQLVGHRGGRSEQALLGLRADLRDAFTDDAPWLEIAVDPDEVDADVVVVLAGATVSTDPSAPSDRAALAEANRAVFATYAEALAGRPDRPSVVIVQSNPVELGVAVLARALGRHRVLGAGAWSDTLRFRREVADGLGVRRRDVSALVLGEHGDHLVPVWSSISAFGRSRGEIDRWVAAQRAGRDLGDLPGEVRAARTALLDRIRQGEVARAYAEVGELPADLRAALKPFFTHFTAGHTTEVATAHAVADLVASLATSQHVEVPAQVVLDGEPGGLAGVGAVPVVLGRTGWRCGSLVGLAGDERRALEAALAAGAATAAHP